MRNLLCLFFISILCFPLLVGTSFAETADSAQKHKKETVWTCSMHPQIQLPEPGQCPICFMDLIEVEKQHNEARQSLRQISLDSQARKLAEIEVKPVIKGAKDADAAIQIFGRIDYDETRVSTITSWVDGRIDKLFVDYTGATVQRGQAVAEVYSPDLFTAQAELIQALKEVQRVGQSGNALVQKMATRTLAAAKEKLRLLGIGKKQLEKMKQLDKPADHITLTAPLSGIVIEKHVNEGVYVKTGNPVYTLADLAHVWVILEVYESDLHAVSMGQKVGFTVEAYPGTAFQGKVVYIDPLVDAKNRTVRVRLNADNSKGKLKPGMFVRAEISVPAKGKGQAPLLIPASAPLLTGKRALVYVQVPDKPGTYIGREIVLGSRRGDYYEVQRGLKEGELVVVRGNFKIDSAIQLQARPSMMNPYTGDAEEQGNALPSLFSSRLNLLNQRFVTFSSELHKLDANQYRPALHEFSHALAAISKDGLKEEESLSWQEFAMLLKNDVFLLQEAKDDQEVLQIYAEFAEHFQKVREHFALQDVPAAQAASPELQAKVGELLKSYLILQQNLAADNEHVAQDAAKALVPLTQKLATMLRQTGKKEAINLATRLQENVEKLVAAKNLEAIRTAFYPYSQAVVETVETYGSNDHSSWFVHFCPMAFGSTGATWLAPSEEINNPYFGTMMLHCGEVRKQLTQE